jgi:hypothetical protein
MSCGGELKYKIATKSINFVDEIQVKRTLYHFIQFWFALFLLFGIDIFNVQN